MNITDPIFHDEAKAEEHIFRSRWPDGEPICPHCESTNCMVMAGKTQAGYWLCRSCRDKFTVRTGTVMERSHIPLHKWLLATHLMAASKKGMSAKQMERMLGVTYKTAWFLCHRIREAMDEANKPNEPLGGPGKTVEADETFVGGFKHKRLSGKVAPKKIVLSLVDRSSGKARSFHIANVDGSKLRGALVTNVDRASRLHTDGHAAYLNVGKEFASHGYTDHKIQYARGDVHSNTAENFFSILKRGVIGVYHHWSQAHIHRYLAEFDMRYSTKDKSDTERAADILRGMEGRRLTYRRISPLSA